MLKYVVKKKEECKETALSGGECEGQSREISSHIHHAPPVGWLARCGRGQGTFRFVVGLGGHTQTQRKRGSKRGPLHLSGCVKVSCGEVRTVGVDQPTSPLGVLCWCSGCVLQRSSDGDSVQFG